MTMTERPKKERKASRTGAFVAGLVIGAFAGAVTTLLLLDDEPEDELDVDDLAGPAPLHRSTARAESAPPSDDELTN